MFIMSRLSVIDLANFYVLKYIHPFIFLIALKIDVLNFVCICEKTSSQKR